MKHSRFFLLCSILLTACAQAPQRVEPVQPSEPVQSPESVQPPEPAHTPELPEKAGPALPHIELSEELLYEFLLAEIASQRGNKALAAEASADLFRKTRDPRLAKRAAQLAFETGDMNKAIAAFKQWQEVEPDSSFANGMLASIFLRGGRLDEAREEWAKVLQAEGNNPGNAFLHIYRMVEQYPDKPAALKLLRELAQPYLRIAEARWSVAQLALLAGDEELALGEARQARSLRPEWDAAALLEAKILQKTSPQQALEVVSGYLVKYPDAREVRLQYARALLDQKQYLPAREEFRRLAKDNPENSDLALAVALVSLQMNDFESAEEQLKQALERGKKNRSIVQYYLGQLSEAKQNEDEALERYREVKDGEYLFAAQARVAYLLGKQGKLDEARKFLHQIEATDNQHRVRLALVEAQLLRDAKRAEEAYQVLQQNLAKLPNHPDLLYEAAMLADKTGKPAVFEKLMRKLIQIKPDHAHAYNALGYSLLERNERIPEAVELVEKALQLAPDDFAIMDSVGWGYYRSGRLEESVKMLRRAFIGNTDAEIAAHLGEVLWVRGDREEARKIWEDSLKEHPGNEVLQSVIRKFIP